MTRKIAIEIISFLFILLFVYAAVSKLVDYQKFVVQVGQSPLLTGLGGFIPWMVISFELMIVAMLFTNRLRLTGLFASFGIMVMFTAYIISILTFSPYVPCSCGGILENLNWSEHILFNSVFILLGLAGILLQARESRASRVSEISQNTFEDKLEHL